MKRSRSTLLVLLAALAFLPPPIAPCRCGCSPVTEGEASEREALHPCCLAARAAEERTSFREACGCLHCEGRDDPAPTLVADVPRPGDPGLSSPPLPAAPIGSSEVAGLAPEERSRGAAPWPGAQGPPRLFSPVLRL